MIFSYIALALCHAVVKFHGVEQNSGKCIANVTAANATPGTQFILMQNDDVSNKDGWMQVYGFVVPENYETMGNGESTFKLMMPDSTTPGSHYAIKMISNGQEYYSRPWMCGAESWTPSRSNEQEIKMNGPNPAVGGAAGKTTTTKTKTTNKKKKNSASSIFGTAIVAISVASSIAVFLL